MKSYILSKKLTSHWWKVPHVDKLSVSTLEGSVRPWGSGALGLLTNLSTDRYKGETMLNSDQVRYRCTALVQCTVVVQCTVTVHY